jgi:membrane-associated phospholipid phosphatase
MRAPDSIELRWWLAAGLCLAASLALGAFVSSRTPGRIDVEATALRGQATSLAAIFTLLGRWYVVLAVTIFAAVLAVAGRANPLPIALLLVSQTVAQGVGALLKLGFRRPRPDGWLLQREPDLSYPSGHAVTAIVFYGALLALALRWPGLPRPLAFVFATLLAAAVVGIPWSRLALGAHYATDVAGGLLLGCAWSCASIALLYRTGFIG